MDGYLTWDAIDRAVWPPAPLVNATGANAPGCTCQPETFLLVPVKPGGLNALPLGSRQDSLYRLVKHKGECPQPDEVWYQDRRIL